MALTQEQKDSGMVLRFSVGDRVECNIGSWAAGTVVKQWYRDESWPQGKWAPYQVQLDQGTLIYAPVDSDKAIKELEEDDLEYPEPELPRDMSGLQPPRPPYCRGLQTKRSSSFVVSK